MFSIVKMTIHPIKLIVIKFYKEAGSKVQMKTKSLAEIFVILCKSSPELVSNLKPIFWQRQSEVEQSNENQENQMKIKGRFRESG